MVLVSRRIAISVAGDQCFTGRPHRWVLIFKRSFRVYHGTKCVCSAMISLVTLKPQLSPSYLLPQFTARQERLLEELFVRDKNPKDTELELLATEAEVGIFQIKIWFEDRIARWRQGQGLQANYRNVSEFRWISWKLGWGGGVLLTFGATAKYGQVSLTIVTVTRPPESPRIRHKTAPNNNLFIWLTWC